MTHPPIIAARNLTKRFPIRSGNVLTGRPPASLNAVEDVSLEVHAGEAVGLVGESGCGKSTLSRLLCRLIDASSGQILIDGQEVSGISSAAFARSPLRRDIQMVFQDPTDSLNPRFSVFDLIADPLRQLDPPGSRAALRRQVEATAASVNLSPELLSRFPHQLSAGQKARVGIARAMIVEPRLLVLDEPTSALDVSVQATVLQLLNRIRRDQGVALLFVSHDLDVVRLLCSRIIVMYLGQIVESGDTASLFQAPAHPYTKALLSAILSPRGREHRDRIRLDGDPQSPIDPTGLKCRLYGRCPAQQGICGQSEPELRPFGDGRQVRCHLADPEQIPSATPQKGPPDA